MSETPIGLGPKTPETVLPDPPADLLEAVDQALTLEPEGRKQALYPLAAQYPTSSEVWARLSEAASADIEAYAYARVGYHRGLDALRASGWKGNGFVRWSNPSNRGFLRALENLRRRAEAIGETTEAQRCELFIRQLDPTWPGID